MKVLTPIELVDRGLIKRVRGICYTTRLNPSMASRVIDTAKGQLLRYARDVFIYSDHYKGAESGQSPGYGLTLVAETTSGCFISAEIMAEPQMLPDDLARECTDQLLAEILLVCAFWSLVIVILAGWLRGHLKPIHRADIARVNSRSRLYDSPREAVRLHVRLISKVGDG